MFYTFTRTGAVLCLKKDEVIQKARKDGFYNDERQAGLPTSRILELTKNLSCFTGKESEEYSI